MARRNLAGSFGFTCSGALALACSGCLSVGLSNWWSSNRWKKKRM